MRTPFLKATLSAVATLALAIPGQAGVTRLVVEHTETLGKDGYQKLTGRVYGELDPKLPLNAIITDLELAPRNARGMVLNLLAEPVGQARESSHAHTERQICTLDVR